MQQPCERRRESSTTIVDASVKECHRPVFKVGDAAHTYVPFSLAWESGAWLGRERGTSSTRAAQAWVRATSERASVFDEQSSFPPVVTAWSQTRRNGPLSGETRWRVASAFCLLN